MNIFIDTNVFLAFYHLTSEDLEELKKLSVLLQDGKVTLLLPEQVVNEYHRNRENKIASAIKGLKEQKLNLEFPALCKDYDQYQQLRDLQKQYQLVHNALLSQIDMDIENNSLKADAVIGELFTKAHRIESTDELIEIAYRRVQVGNPPGKNDSVGDAINWEALVAEVPKKEDLFVITDDRDFYSALNENRPKAFLVNEWKTKKDSDVVFFRRLSAFFKAHYPDIKLASELERELAVRQLVTSQSFETTHSAIVKLEKFEGFSESQVNDMAIAAVQNSQVNWILRDIDVHRFFSKLVEEYEDELESETFDTLVQELNPKRPNSDDSQP